MSLQKICTKVTVKSLVKLEVLFSRKKVCNAPPSFFQTPHNNSLIRTAGGEAKVSVFSMSSEVILMSSQSSGTTGLLLSSYY